MSITTNDMIITDRSTELIVRAASEEVSGWFEGEDGDDDGGICVRGLVCELI